MGATVLNEQGKEKTMTMGCYGIGVTRIVAAAIEQNNDDKGMIWPAAIAPFQVALLPMNMKKSQRVREAPMSSTRNCRPPALMCCWMTDRYDRA